VTEPTDGLEFDAQGNLYMTALEESAIKVLRPDGKLETVTTAPEFQWPDTITMSHGGDLLFSASQFHLMPAFNQGVDKRNPPYKVFRLRPSDHALL
jgi:sugar lactone lactonase YvrE